MTISRALPWAPPRGPDVQMLPSGRWWDALRVPLPIGMLALEHLGEKTGAVIEDGYGSILYWLVRPGTADDWEFPEVQVLSRGCHLAVPPQHRTRGPGLYWRVPPTGRRFLAEAERLHRALRSAFDDSMDPPRPTTKARQRYCCRCERATEAPVPVRFIATRSGPERVVYACPDCAPFCGTRQDHLEWRTSARWHRRAG